MMAGLWPLRLRSLHAGFWPCERVMGVKENPVALGVMAGLWPFRLRSLHADFCAGETHLGEKKLKKPKLQTVPVRHNPISFDDAQPTHALTSSRNQV
ncbi:hypothetical protein PY95_12420 [Lacticaseibacillus rhamnosus]|nr:hypothetical protein PY95_12420 [Lacticaseibacillus rhamnosus]OAT97139.1 hypothetical protein PY72_12420 [Lacticaseibacillus rhamnosus]